MKNTTLRLAALIFIAPLVVVTTGCVVARTTASNTVAFIRGALEEVVDAPLDRVGKASEEAVKEMKFLSATSKVDSIEGEITARTAQDTRITILLNKVTQNSTKISIRVGAFGDEAVSRQILEQIKKNL